MKLKELIILKYFLIKEIFLIRYYSNAGTKKYENNNEHKNQECPL